MRNKVKELDDVGYDLLIKFLQILQINSRKRILAEEALKHSYFNDLDEKIKALYCENDI